MVTADWLLNWAGLFVCVCACAGMCDSVMGAGEMGLAASYRCLQPVGHQQVE